MTIDNIIVML